jgi:outer membrane protein assembly factor BamD
MIRKRPVALVIAWSLVLLAGSGCALLDRVLTKRPEASIGSDQDLLSRGEAAISQKRYEEGRKHLQRLVNQFPESELVPAARLGVARAYLQERRYDEARAEYHRFIELFPQHERVDEAHYYLGLSYYRQMEKTDRDQTLSKKAIAEFQTVAAEFRDSQYAADARLKRVHCIRQLADKELYIGKFYFRRGSYGAAINRFETVLKEYPGTGYDADALYYLGESLRQLEQHAAARTAFERLVKEFPDSELAPLGAQRIGVTLPEHPNHKRPRLRVFTAFFDTVKSTFSEIRDSLLDNDIWQAWLPN